MGKEINIAELLKDCPKGMELYSPIFEEVYLDKIIPHLAVVVTLGKEQGEIKEVFLYDGRYGINGGCMLFPSKGKTTWEGFVPPCKFEDGDVVATKSGLFIGIVKIENGVQQSAYVAINGINNLSINISFRFERFATFEEKEKLFQAIKDNGYKWNAETKTLEKLSKFKVGDIIQYVDGYKVRITEVNIHDECYSYESIIAKGIGSITFNEQNSWELVPNKFDTDTLKPFDKVLVRDNNEQLWVADLFGFHDDRMVYKFMCVGHNVNQCIPYNDETKHLLGTTDDCDKYFKTWK